MAEMSNVLCHRALGLRQLTGGKRKSHRIQTVSLDLTPARPVHEPYVAQAESPLQPTCAFKANTLNGLQVIILNLLLMALFCTKETVTFFISLFHGTKIHYRLCKAKTPDLFSLTLSNTSASLPGTFHRFTWGGSCAPDQFFSCLFGPKHWSKVEDQDRGQEVNLQCVHGRLTPEKFKKNNNFDNDCS